MLNFVEIIYALVPAGANEHLTKGSEQGQERWQLHSALHTLLDCQVECHP